MQHVSVTHSHRCLVGLCFSTTCVMCVAQGFAAVNWHCDREHLLVWVKEMKLRSMQTGMSVQAQMARKCHQSAVLGASKPVWKRLIFTGFPLLPGPACSLCSAHRKCSPLTFISTCRYAMWFIPKCSPC